MNFEDALNKIQHDQKKYRKSIVGCCSPTGVTGPTGPTGPAGGPTGPTA